MIGVSVYLILNSKINAIAIVHRIRQNQPFFSNVNREYPLSPYKYHYDSYHVNSTTIHTEVKHRWIMKKSIFTAVSLVILDKR